MDYANEYARIISAAGGEMSFAQFVEECRAEKIDARLWLRAKHAGKLFSWIDGEGTLRVSVSPTPTKK